MTGENAAGSTVRAGILGSEIADGVVKVRDPSDVRNDATLGGIAGRPGATGSAEAGAACRTAITPASISLAGAAAPSIRAIGANDAAIIGLGVGSPAGTCVLVSFSVAGMPTGKDLAGVIAVAVATVTSCVKTDAGLSTVGDAITAAGGSTGGQVDATDRSASGRVDATDRCARGWITALKDSTWESTAAIDGTATGTIAIGGTATGSIAAVGGGGPSASCGASLDSLGPLPKRACGGAFGFSALVVVFVGSTGAIASVASFPGRVAGRSTGLVVLGPASEDMAVPAIALKSGRAAGVSSIGSG